MKKLYLLLFGILLISLASSSRWTDSLNQNLTAYFNMSDGNESIFGITNFSNFQVNNYGLIGNGYTADSSGGSVQAGITKDLQSVSVLGNSSSINLWVYIYPNNTNNELKIFHESSSGIGRPCEIKIINYSYYRGTLFDSCPNDNVLPPNSNISWDRWNMITIVHTYNGTERIFLNSSLIYESPNAYDDYKLSDVTYINYGGFNGLMDEIGFWNRSLSNEEVSYLWNDGQGITWIRNPNMPPNILFNSTVPVYPALGNQSAFINVTLNDTEGDTILYVNFTLISPNLTYIFSNENGSFIGGSNDAIGYEWHSPLFNISYLKSSLGSWNWTYTIVSNGSTPTTSQIGFFIVNDSIKPNLSINFPLNYSFLMQNISIDFNFTAKDDIGIDSCWYSLDDGISNLTILNCSSNQTLNFRFPSGVYNFSIWANDSFNNVQANKTYNITIFSDITPPNLSINFPQGVIGNITFTISINASDIGGLNKCFYNVTRGASLDVVQTEILNCSTQDVTPLSGDAIYTMFISASDISGNTNYSSIQFNVSSSGHIIIIGGGGGGGGVGETLIPVIGLLEVNSTKTYSTLDREVLYAYFNNFCSQKIRKEPLAIVDYSDQCSLTKSELDTIQLRLSLLSITIENSDLSKFYSNYKNNRLFQGTATQEQISRYSLYISTLGITTPLSFSTPSINKPVYVLDNKLNFTIRESITANKPISDCYFLNEVKGLSCQVEDTKIVFEYSIANPNFFRQKLSALAVITTQADSSKVEQKSVPINIEIYNIAYPIFGIQAYLFVIISIALSFVTLLVIFRRKIKLKSLINPK